MFFVSYVRSDSGLMSRGVGFLPSLINIIINMTTDREELSDEEKMFDGFRGCGGVSPLVQPFTLPGSGERAN